MTEPPKKGVTSQSLVTFTGTSDVPAQLDILTKFLAGQEKANELREHELTLQQYNAETERKKVDTAHEFALKALEAQAQDRKDERQMQAKNNRGAFWVSLLAVLGLFGIVGFALYGNKDQLIIEIMRILFIGGGGGGIGYAAGLKKGARLANSPEEPTP